MAHCAIIAKIDEVFEIPGAEKIHVARVLGEDVIVGKDWGVGYIGLFFPVDVQLSEQFCYENNLYRKKEKNKDQTKAGFFDDNRRVRAQPFMKVKSCGYFTSIESLRYIPGFHNYELGQTFDETNSVKICQKYISEQARKQMEQNGNKKKVKNVEMPFFPKHIDTEQFKHFSNRIPVGSLLTFTGKLHGTSFRVGKTLVKRELQGFKKFINRFIPMFQTEQYEYVVGTRNVILDNPEKEGFHGSEAYRFDVLNQLKPYLEDGMLIFGEIVGFVNGKPIMPNHNIEALKNKEFTKKYGKEITYSYGCAPHEFKFYVYRIVRQTANGDLVDVPHAQVENWCANRNINCVQQVHPQVVYDGNLEKLCVDVEYLTERPEVLTEDFVDPSHISEGVVVRVDSNKDTPDFYKSKSFAFRAMEGLVEVADEETIN